MPAVGSSRNTTSGRPISASASDSRWRWPPERRRTTCAGVAQPDEVEQPLGVVGVVVERGEQPQRFERPHARVQPALLEHHADARAQRGRVARRVEAEDPHRAGVGGAVALEDLDGRGLARAVRPEQAEHLADADREVEPVDGRAIAVALHEPA